MNLIAADQFVRIEQPVFLRAEKATAQRNTLGIEHAPANAAAAIGREQIDRHGDQTKRDRAGPESARTAFGRGWRMLARGRVLRPALRRLLRHWRVSV